MRACTRLFQSRASQHCVDMNSHTDMCTHFGQRNSKNLCLLLTPGSAGVRLSRTGSLARAQAASTGGTQVGFIINLYIQNMYTNARKCPMHVHMTDSRSLRNRVIIRLVASATCSSMPARSVCRGGGDQSRRQRGEPRGVGYLTGSVTCAFSAIALQIWFLYSRARAFAHTVPAAETYSCCERCAPSWMDQVW